MDFKFLATSIKNIILNPGNTWDVIHSENKPVKYVKGNLFYPLLILAAVSAFLGSFFFINTGLSNVYSVLSGIKYLILFALVIYATAFVLAEMTKALHLGSDFGLSFKIIAYSAVPFLICQIISRMFESFIFINVLALYGLYIFWIGVEKMLNSPEHKKLPLLIAATLAFILLLFAVNWILTWAVDKLYFAFFA